MRGEISMGLFNKKKKRTVLKPNKDTTVNLPVGLEKKSVEQKHKKENP
tara:strand:- start:586 stop:729 length:144 start_codon:yes stop_codon:yes gene_type:complete